VKFFLIFLATALALYLVVGIVLYVFQRNFLYYPTPVVSHEYDEIAITVDTATKIKIIKLNPDKRNAVIYFGGNADTVINHAKDLSRALTDTTIYLVNYRGYGVQWQYGWPTKNLSIVWC